MPHREAAMEEKLRTTEADLNAKIDVLRSELGGVEQRLDAKIDGVEQRLTATIHSEVKGLDAKIDALDKKIDGVEQRLDAKIDGVEQRLTATIHSVEQRLDAKSDGVEQRLTATIHSEVSSAVGSALERFSEIFGVVDEKYGTLVGGVRQDLDEHRFDRSLHLQAEKGPRPRSTRASRRVATRPAPKTKKKPPRKRS